MADALNPAILKTLVNKSGTNEPVVRVQISLIRRKYPGITLNAAAQFFASKRGFSVMGSLDKEDRQSLSFTNITSSQLAKSGVRGAFKGLKSQHFKIFLHYQTTNPFQQKHINEVNLAYNAKCYTAVFILCRKIIENLIIDLLIKRFPEKKQKNRELYFDINGKRFHDFSKILSNLYKNRSKFPLSVLKAIERLVQRARPFVKDANDKTHSWFHMATKPEIDHIEVKEIIDLIIQIDSAIK